MIIEYEVSNFVKEKRTIEIADTKNIFLKGTNPYDGLSTYFGIWTNKIYLSIVTLISDRCVSYDCTMNKNVYTECDIKKYLANNKNVKVISKAEFTEKLKDFNEKIEI